MYYSLKKQKFLKAYTFLLLTTALFGVNFISIDIGIIQLSPYRILILFSPFILFIFPNSSFKLYFKNNSFEYINFLLFWILYSLITLIWVKDYSAWAKMFFTLFNGYLLTCFIRFNFKSNNDYIRSFKIIEFSSFIFGCIAIYEIYTGNYLFLNERSLDYYQSRSQIVSTIGLRTPVSIFSNPNNYAFFIVFSIFISIGLVNFKKTFLGKLISLFFVFLFILLLLSTQSRSGFIGFSLGLLVFGLIKFKSISRKSLWKLAIFFILLFSYFIPLIIENINLFASLATIDFDKNYGSDLIRINLLKNGFYFLKDSLFLGVGLGNIEYYMEHFKIFQVESITNIHNFWMEILVSSGIIVFILFLIIFYRNCFRMLKDIYGVDQIENKKISTVFLSFLIAFILLSVGPSSLIYNEWYWLIMALIFSYVDQLRLMLSSNNHSNVNPHNSTESPHS